MAPSSGTRSWRVYVTYTSEFGRTPLPQYMAAVNQAIAEAGHIAVHATQRSTGQTPPLDVVAEQVRGCDVFIGLLGTRSAAIVRDGPGASYAELAFDIASEVAVPRLVFLFDEDAHDDVLPASTPIDEEFSDSQDAFRERVRNSGLVAESFGTPSQLQHLVYQALIDMVHMQQRIASGLRQERSTAETRVQPPFALPLVFRDRNEELASLAAALADPRVRLVTVIGQAGVGKSALVWRCVTDPPNGLRFRSIIGLSPGSARGVSFRSVASDLIQLLSAERQRRLERLVEDAERAPDEVMAALLREFPAGDRVVIVLDDLDGLLNEDAELKDGALLSALLTLLNGPEHSVVVITTSRVKPAESTFAEYTVILDRGLPLPDSAALLRDLDPSGQLGLLDAPDRTIAQLHALTDGMPRALEAIATVLAGDPTSSVADILRQYQEMAPQQLADTLVGQAIGVLDRVHRRVLESLAVFRFPVPRVAVEFLLQPYVPGLDPAPILESLERQRLVTSRDGRYTVDATDRVQILKRIPLGASDDVPPAFTFAALRARAVEYYLAVQPGNRDEERTRLIHDQPASKDQLGRQALAGEIAALVDQLARDDDRPEAFAIHLDAPWGAGKTTLVGLIVDELSGMKKPWVTIQMDAWRSSQLSPAWWALLSHLRTGVRASLTPIARVLFDLRWFGHEVTRLWRYGLPLLAAVAVLAVLAVFDIVNGKPSYLGSVGSIAALIALLVTFATLGGKFLSLGSLQAARIHERVNQNPMDEVAQQFIWIRRRVKRPVLLVLDDLDRCNGAFAVELLDAVQTLLRNRLDLRHPPSPLVVLAVGDHRWLEVAYEQSYNMFAKRVSEAGRPLGRLFLDKLFQLSITLPKINSGQMGRYLSALLYGPDARSPAAGPVAADSGLAREELIRGLQGEVRAVVHNAPEKVDEGLARIAGKAYELLDGSDFDGIVDYALKSRRADENRALREKHLLERYADLLDPNPRAAKRFLMAYSVNYAARLSEGGDFESKTLALWTLLSIRWPTLADWVLERLPDKSLEPMAEEGHPSQLLHDPEVNRVVRSDLGGPLDRDKVLRCCGYRVSDPAVVTDDAGT